MDKLREECGVFGIYGHTEAANLTYLGLYALQHRGQESVGIATSDGDRLRMHKAMGYVADNFSEETFASLSGTSAIGHVRYSTAGESGLKNAQPILIDCAHGEIAVGHNGNLDQRAGAARSPGRRRLHLPDDERYRGAAAPLRTVEGADRRAGAVESVTQAQGAFSLVFLTKDRLIAIRDPARLPAAHARHVLATRTSSARRRARSI